MSTPVNLPTNRPGLWSLLVANWRADLLAGFLVFLIALPLCLAISLACGFPAIAGVYTAIIGGVLTTFISNSELTIKGPAAGLIVIVLGCVQDFGGDGVFSGDSDAAMTAYRLTLGIGVAAGIVQIAFALMRSGVLGEFFPTATVHGLLAAIGVIIFAKEFPKTFGVKPQGTPLELLAHIPQELRDMNPEIALIGVISLIILFGKPLLKNKYIKMIPAQMLVVLVAIPLGIWLDLEDTHTYTMFNSSYEIGPSYLVNVPMNIFSGLTMPDFSGLSTGKGWYWVAMFALIGTLESMLSAKAVESIDPQRRKTNLNRDILAIGVANSAAAFVGGLPMISEIVRSRANIDSGARSRFADMFHSLFLLSFLALAPGLIHRIPLAALSAMLVYTGFRLASPREFMNVYRVGREQLVIFVVTIIAVLATDLLIGIGIGIAVKIAIHMLNGVPLSALIKPDLEIEDRDDNTSVVRAKQAAVFSNWIMLRRRLEQAGLEQKRSIVFDLSGTRFVDHTVMEKLHELGLEFEENGLGFEVIGLDSHQGLSQHPFSARKRGLAAIRRITIVTDPAVEQHLAANLVSLGVSGYTSTPCSGAGRHQLAISPSARKSRVRIEVLVTHEHSQRVLDYLRREIVPHWPSTICVEVVHVMSSDGFESNGQSLKHPRTVGHG